VMFLMSCTMTAIAAAPPQFYKYDQTTGSNMTIVLQISTNPTIDGAPLGDSDEIGAFNKAGLCVGEATWDSVTNRSINVVGQDPMSSITDGLKYDDTIYFRVWHYATQREAPAVVTFSSGGVVYVTNTSPVISSLTATTGAVSDPLLTSPASGATGQPISLTLYWGSVAGATSYGVQVSANGEFGSTIFSQTGLTAQSAVIGGLAYNTVYYWRGNASNKSVTSIWAGVWSFTTLAPPGAPALLTPTNGATDISPSLTLSWQTVTSAASYGVKVATVSTFAATASNQTGLGTGAASLSGLAPGIAYFWEVNATNGAGTGAWSGIWSFETITLPATPSLSTPLNGSAESLTKTTSLTLSWGTVATASSYSLQVSTTSAFITAFVNQTGITAANRAVSNWPASAVYFWRVSATNPAGTSVWSSSWSFSITVPVLSQEKMTVIGLSFSYRNGCIRWSIPADGKAELTVYDILGRIALSSTLVGKAGDHAMNLRSILSGPGRYVARVRCGSFDRQISFFLSH